MNSKDLVTFAISFLEEESGAPKELIRKYMETPNFDKPTDLNTIYWRMVASIQNNQGMPNTIGKSLPNNIESLRTILFDFDPKKVANTYSELECDLLFEKIKVDVGPTGKLRDAQGSHWPKFCRGVISAAFFLSQFNSGDEFHHWAKGISQYPKAFAGLPLIISQEVFSLGFALACDFIKEIGYTQYGKPDVHVKRILLGIGQIPREDNYLVLKKLSQIAEEAGETAFGVDKLFYLIGSGQFSKEDQESNSISSKKNGARFIDAVNERFQS